MLDQVDLGAKLSKKEYKRRLPGLQGRLLELQHACWQEKVGSLVVFEGWDTAGRGDVIGKVTERLEPRGFELHMVREPRSFEARLPWMWRFWSRLPAYGQMALFDYSWYRRFFVQRLEPPDGEPLWPQHREDILAFEAMLAADRYVLIKIFLHISREEKARRLEKRWDNPLDRWRLSQGARQSLQRYDDYHRLIQETLERTHTEEAPWTVVAATQKRWRRVRVLETLIQGLERGLQSAGGAVAEEEKGEERSEAGAAARPGETEEQP